MRIMFPFAISYLQAIHTAGLRAYPQVSTDIFVHVVDEYKGHALSIFERSALSIVTTQTADCTEPQIVSARQTDGKHGVIAQ